MIQRESPKPRRRGYGTVEVVVSTLLIALAMGLVARGVGWMATLRRGADRRAVALQEAANQMERLAARPWVDLTADSARSLKLSPSATAVLPSGTIELVVSDAPGEPKAKRVAVAIRWKDASMEEAASVRLVSWVHRPAPGGER